MGAPSRAVAVAAALAALAPGARAQATDPLGSAEAGPAAVEVVVCESHERALFHWLRAADEGRIPRSGVTVVHFDAHPDMAVPVGQFAARWRRQPARLVASADIATFQLAAVGAGLVERIVWLRPAWAKQLPDGARRFQLGVIDTGSLRVDDRSDYYVLDGAWAPRRALRDPIEVRLRVLPLESARDELALAAHGAVVFDIDLDGFATRNPAAEALRQQGLNEADIERLRVMFDPDRLALDADPQLRVAQVAALMGALEGLAVPRWGAVPGALLALWGRGLGVGDLLALSRILSRAKGSAAVDMLLEQGRELVGLPEHRADPHEVAHTAALLGELVARGSVRPALVTIARSVRDGFTPREAWPGIEQATLDALGEALGSYTLRFDAGLSPAPAVAAPRAQEPAR